MTIEIVDRIGMWAGGLIVLIFVWRIVLFHLTRSD